MDSKGEVYSSDPTLTSATPPSHQPLRRAALKARLKTCQPSTSAHPHPAKPSGLMTQSYVYY